MELISIFIVILLFSFDERIHLYANNVPEDASEFILYKERLKLTDNGLGAGKPQESRVSLKKCLEKYLDCSRDHRTLGGNDALPGEFPHLVGVMNKHMNAEKIVCGGSLISEDFVLTAAHCLFSIRNNNFMKVRLGARLLHDDSIHENVTYINVKEAVLHPQFSFSMRYHDIALLRLEKPVEFSNTIRPICLWQGGDNYTSPFVRTAGWKIASTYACLQAFKCDDLYLDGNSNNNLKVEDLKVASHEECQRAFPRTIILRNGISQEQMCAGDRAGGNNNCQGDSGGPLMMPHTDNTCADALVGLLSFSKRCGVTVLAAYTKVAPYLDWIESVVWPGFPGE